MKLPKRIATIGAITVVVAGLSVTAICAQPGTTDDPLVSKSYVDQRISQLMSLFSGSGATLPTMDGGGDSANLSFKAINVPEGKIVIGNEGTEIILRSGEANSYTEAANGMVNVTAGTELMSGERIIHNNLLLTPRADGRGAKALTDCWFMIKGGYHLK